MNKQSKFFIVCAIMEQRNNISKLAPHEKETIKQTIDVMDSLELDAKVYISKKEPIRSFGFKHEAWIFAAFLAGCMLVYLIGSYI